ncbi:cyanophycin synthetase [Rhodohalobacter sp. SW132]|uniref:cyanophycin synthetase n=1 Tax=Rhodohalobacter sp. SW132 TaxID=2293433 RepID=UPI000E2263DF|nr:cyanophycin synthetase [Rhodohalobacter sp. SW132]REL32899.1 cyanophycin synthetase [Rhodohalobacter sp. SW132]
MNILNINVMSGPNNWSVKRHQLIVLELDIGDLEYLPTNEIDGFYERITALLPGLYDHHCSEGEPGGFFARVKEGTWIGHVIEHIAIELQVMADIDTSFGQTRGTGVKGHYFVVFDCADEESGRLTAEIAVLIAQNLVDGTETDLDQHIEEIKMKNRENSPGPSTSSILKEALSRDIPTIKLEDNSTWQLGYGCNQKRISATITSATSNTAVETVCNKEVCRDLLKSMSVPIAEGDAIDSLDELKDLIDSLGFPLVIKPAKGNQGRGVTTDITSFEEAEKAFGFASTICKRVIVEKYIPGFDYRLLMVDGKLAAAAKRTPAHVVGDGKSTVQQLIDKVNRDPKRGDGHENVLTKIKIGPAAKTILSQKNYTLSTVLKSNEILHLDYAANLSKGGTAEDVTERVHPDVVKVASRVSKITGLDICGIDLMAKTLTKPLSETGGVVLEVNAAPGFRMHLSPSKGAPQNVAAPVVDMLFPDEKSARIPIMAVTGTNGKTTTTRLISHIMKEAGRSVGYTTTDGVYVNDQRLMKGDCGGPKSAQLILKDPTVDTAVLECARGGILRAGLGFDRCDVAAVTNVAADHLGMKGIQTLDQMADLKSVVPESVHPGGHAVLNADDDRVYAMRKKLQCKPVLFSMQDDSIRLKRHRKAGGICAVLTDKTVVIWDGQDTHTIEHIENIPLSFDGRALFMIENILAAVAVAYTQKISPAVISRSLRNFKPSPEQTPGRMNLFQFEDFDVLVDYCHNPAGMNAIKEFIDNSSYLYKTGIICGIGDRREEDSLELGHLAAELFCKIIIREDSDLRGKNAGETSAIVRRGIEKSCYNPPVVNIANEKQALLFAMENALPGTLVMLSVEHIEEVTSLLKKMQLQENDKRITKPVRKVIQMKKDHPAEMNMLQQ